MKILIAVPCMDQVAAPFAQSLASLNKVGECAVSFMCNSLIYDSRNRLAKQAVDIEADYVMWFDSDMIFQPDTLQKLLDDDCDIVSGLYFRRLSPFTPVIFSSCEKDSEGYYKWNDCTSYPEEVFEVAGIGFGCVLVKTDVFLEMFGKFGDCFTPLGKFGEDLSFCFRAKELGYKIHCDPRIKCGHVSHSVVTEDFYKAFSFGGMFDESKS